MVILCYSFCGNYTVAMCDMKWHHRKMIMEAVYANYGVKHIGLTDLAAIVTGSKSPLLSESVLRCMPNQ